MTAAPPLPAELQVEVTAACNLRCRMCLVCYRPALDRRHASLGLAELQALVESLPGLRKLTLQGIGEPLMAPDIVPMVAWAAGRGIRVGFNTNGTLLTRAMAQRLVQAGLGWLNVSVDGASAATFESIRQGASFAKVERNVRGLVEVIRADGRGRPDVGLVFVAMRRNVHELPAVIRNAGAWGVPTVRVQNLSHSFSDRDGVAGYAEIAAFTAAEALWPAPGGGAPDAAGARASAAAARHAFAEAARLAAGLGVDLRLPELDESPRPRAAGEPGCDWPWRSAYVRHDGRAQPCCMLMGGDRGVLGDALADFPALWRGDAYREFRAALLGNDPPEVCRGCSMFRGVF